jgi:hypothetical protein
VGEVRKGGRRCEEERKEKEGRGGKKLSEVETVLRKGKEKEEMKEILNY